MFTQLHLHSHYSLLDAIGTPAKYVSKAAELHMTALALTDYSWMYGVIEFYKACKKKEIQPILGIEIALVQDRRLDLWKHKPWTITLLAKNYEGYLSLLEIASHGNLEWYQSQPCIDREVLQWHTQHLIWFMWWSQSYIWKLISNNEDISKIKDTLELLTSYFSAGDFYLEYVVQNEQKMPEEKKVNHLLLQAAKEYSLPLFCSTNVHYIDQEDKEAFEVAMAIKDGKRIYDEERRKTKWDFSLQSEDEVRSICERNWLWLADINTMIKTTEAIVEKIDITLPLW